MIINNNKNGKYNNGKKFNNNKKIKRRKRKNKFYKHEEEVNFKEI
jgi:hypothetical protein